MLKQLRNKTEGFTIIEVMIVLAIAGLILLIVFLAVPALQRNSRNTQVRNAANDVLGAINDYQSNNNGAGPGLVCADTATGNLYMQSGNTLPGGGCAVAPDVISGKVQAGTPVTSTFNNAAPTWPATGSILIDFGYTCSGNAVGSASTRASIALFVTESASSTTNQQCIQS